MNFQSMGQSTFSYHSYLFQLRMWKEKLGDGHSEWRGRLEHITGEEVHYFREWKDLVTLLINIMAEYEKK